MRRREALDRQGQQARNRTIVEMSAAMRSSGDSFGEPQKARGRASLPVTALVLAAALGASPVARGESPPPARAGKVLLVRGVFTVFSLGLDDLAKQLAAQGVNVEVAPASLSFVSADKIRDQYLKNPATGPIVIIGHSLGGDLAPELARRLQQRNVPVKLIVVVDATNPGAVPGNVERCVNFHQARKTSPKFALVHGAAMKAESRSTELVNVDINKLPGRDWAGDIDHFNIDSSQWVHDMIIREVLHVCPPLPVAEQPGPQRQGLGKE